MTPIKHRFVRGAGQIWWTKRNMRPSRNSRKTSTSLKICRMWGFGPKLLS